ncbi:MAG: DUF1330 domain-containing protein [Geodermatophilaceae bacterium]|nr:DUF1330 domain-containing protein [Geodermatophilaceae bacterium]
MGRGRSGRAPLGLEHPLIVVLVTAYWINTVRTVNDPEKVAAYAALAGPAIEAAGGRFLARGNAAAAFEQGNLLRTVIIEFASVEAAVAAHDSSDYQRALAALGDGAVRDIRVVEALSG